MVLPIILSIGDRKIQEKAMNTQSNPVIEARDPGAQLVPAGGGELTRKRTVDFLPLVQAWHEHLELQVAAGTISQDTANAYSRGMGKFTTWLSDRTPNSDTILEWMAHLKQQGNKPAAINAWLGGVRAFFGWATSRA